MTGKESDPEKCRNLRQAIRQYKSEITRISRELTTELNMLEDLRRIQVEKQKQLDKYEALLNMVRFAEKIGETDLPAAAAGAIGDTAIQAAISGLEGELRAIEGRIRQKESTIAGLNAKHDRATADLARNATELSRLNCVSDW